MTRFDAVLWDMDGTILDSAMHHFHAWRDLLAQHSYDYTYEQFQGGFGQSNHSVLTNLFPAITAAEINTISTEKEILFRRLLARDGAQLLPGVAQWLDHFRMAGVTQVLSSSAPMANITAAVHALDVGDYFAALMSGAHLSKSKPDPLLFLNSAAAAKVDPARCLVIEDSVHGVEAARRAGMVCVVVGSLAEDEAIAAVAAASPGPDLLPVGALDRMTWAQLQEIE